ncbi:MAG: riboflavin synthase [Cyanobacterium sp.]
MFTGLIQGTGKVKSLGNDLYAIAIDRKNHEKITQAMELGDSIAVDGVCLTVEKITKDGFVATASPETLARTTLARSTQNQSPVNLETSLRVGSKIGGHFVSGHVDGIGCLTESKQTQQSWEMTFSSPPTLKLEWEKYLAPYIVSKASIAINGISLTIAECDYESSYFKVAVIPVTYAETNLSKMHIGDWVNLESDILGKYVDKLVSHRLGKQPIQENITLDFLTQHGY